MNFPPKEFSWISRPLLFVISMVFAVDSVLGQCSTGCTITVTSNSSSNFDLSSGQKLCVDANSSDIALTGSITTRPGSATEFCSSGGNEITFNSAWNFYDDGGERTVDIYGDLNRTSATFDKFTTVTIHSGGSFTNTGLMTNGDSVTIINEGDLNVNGTFTLQGDLAQFTNNGTTDISAGLTLNSGAQVVNNSDLTTGGVLTSNSSDFDNNGPLTVNGQFTLNSGSTFDNTNDASFTGDVVLNSGNYTNSGIVESSGRITINGGTSVDLRGGIFISSQLVINSGNFTVGTDNECSAFLVTGFTTINNGISIPAGSTLIVTDSSDLDTVNQNSCGVGNCGLTFSSVNSCYTTLPIELLKFWGTTEQDYAKLHWLVASQKDNNFFTLERSVDGGDFEEIARIQGAGTRNQLMQYHFTDMDVIPRGVVYYRLVQTDFDGTTTVSRIAPVSFGGSHWELFPNPSEGSSIQLVASGVPEDACHFDLMSSMGQTLYEGILYSINGAVDEELHFPQELSSSLYFLRLRLPEGPKVLPFLVE